VHGTDAQVGGSIAQVRPVIAQVRPVIAQVGGSIAQVELVIAQVEAHDAQTTKVNEADVCLTVVIKDILDEYSNFYPIKVKCPFRLYFLPIGAW